MSETELDNAMECILFCSSAPLGEKQLQAMLDIDYDTCATSLTRLAAKYASPSSGLMLATFGHGVQLRTKPEYAQYLSTFTQKRLWKLSKPAMEVLSIIAYRQPIHRAAIDEIRGADSSHLIHTLMDKELTCMMGRNDELPGKPIRYGTTPQFLEIFSLATLRDLPTLTELKEELGTNPQLQ